MSEPGWAFDRYMAARRQESQVIHNRTLIVYAASLVVHHYSCTRPTDLGEKDCCVFCASLSTPEADTIGTMGVAMEMLKEALNG